MDDDIPDEVDFDIAEDEFDPDFEETDKQTLGKRNAESSILPPQKKLRPNEDENNDFEPNSHIVEIEAGTAPIISEPLIPPPEDLIETPLDPHFPKGHTQPISKDLYQLIIRQLQDDGFSDVAEILQEKSEVIPDTDLQTTLSEKVKGHHLDQHITHQPVNINLSLQGGFETKETIDPKRESQRRFGKYEARFQTTHTKKSNKQQVRCCQFSRDGKLAASGSGDIKLLDVGKMHYSVLMKYSKNTAGSDYNITRPVIRTYQDHLDKVNDLDFHPNGEWLLSSGDDGLILYWNLHKQWKRSAECIQERGAVRSIHCHPSGDYFLSGGDYPMIRLYDVETLQGFVSREQNQHKGSVNRVQWSPEGNIFASCSKDGTIKIWDGVSLNCINTIKEAHTGCEVSTIQFSKNSKYILSGGKDSLVKLWDMSTGKCIMNYIGANHKGMRVNSCFSWNDEHVLTSCARTNTIFVWDTKTGVLIERMKEHKQSSKWICSSPTEPALLLGSVDGRTRFVAVQEQGE